MSAQFIAAYCAAPLVRRTLTNSAAAGDAASVTYFDVAPKELWYEPFRAWLYQPDTIATIIDTAEPFSTGFDNWSELVDNAITADAIANEPGMRALLDTLDAAPAQQLDNAADNPYAQRVIDEIAERFLKAAQTAFVDHVTDGVVHKREYLTAGISYGDAPTEHFDDVLLLSWITFFEDYPIAVMDDNAVIGWVDHDGNDVAAPRGITPRENTSGDDMSTK